MCSYQYGGPHGTVVLRAEGDNGNGWGGHSGFWYCEHECERMCDSGGHKFGCLDEGHLRTLCKAVSMARGFKIELDHQYSYLC